MIGRTCKGCGHEFEKWVEFCPECAEPMENFSRPAGFWVRVGATIVDLLVFIPVIALNFWNMYSLKSMPLMIALAAVGMIYKPFMESSYGATLGKMSFGIKVIDDSGNMLTLFSAYIRFLPNLIGALLTLAASIILFLSPAFQSATTLMEMGQAQQGGILSLLQLLMNLFIVIDCVFVAFTFRKRALHDMLAGSYCVYKSPGD
jgi:uncharacterized RDD family membrane protein YckC